MFENNFSIKYGIVYDTVDGYSKKYRCTHAMWLISTLAFTYRVIIYICINAPVHDRSKIYGIARSNKTYLK